MTICRTLIEYSFGPLGIHSAVLIWAGVNLLIWFTGPVLLVRATRGGGSVSHLAAGGERQLSCASHRPGEDVFGALAPFLAHGWLGHAIRRDAFAWRVSRSWHSVQRLSVDEVGDGRGPIGALWEASRNIFGEAVVRPLSGKARRHGAPWVRGHFFMHGTLSQYRRARADAQLRQQACYSFAPPRHLPSRILVVPETAPTVKSAT